MTNPMIKFMILSFLVMSIRADKDLMMKECNHTGYQKTCLMCLESNPTSYNTDRVGFVEIIIHCLESQLDILLNNVTSILSRKGEGEEIFYLEDCGTGFLIAKSRLDEARINVVVLHNYDEAFGLVKTAFGYPQTCRDNLQKLKFKESPEVYNEISFYGQLSSVAMTMIQLLEYFI